MEHSETIGKLIEALSKAQGVLEGATKGSVNPFFNSKYSDLASVWEACRKPLTDNGLAVVQTCCSESPDIVVVETMLSHISGEWISGKVAMKPVKADPQGIGSCITYARRYSLAAIVGVSPEDDDGNDASKPAPAPPKKEPKKDPPKEPAIPKVTAEQKVAIRAKMVEAGITEHDEQIKFYKFVVQEDASEIAAEFIEKFDKALEVWRASNG